MERSATIALNTGDFPEETANQLTHAAGFMLSAAGTIILLRYAQPDPNVQFGCAVYGFSLMALYAASTLSHSFEETSPWRTVFRIVDQVCIYLLIVGSFTPFALVHLQDGPWPLLLKLMWALALGGCISRVVSRGCTVSFYSVMCYVILGWIPICTIGRIYEVGQMGGLMLILASGLSYTGGTWFLLNDQRAPWFHALWHISVISGSFFHYLFILQYVA